MDDPAPREHYIPIRRGDLARLLADDADLTPPARDQFRQFCKLIDAVFHFEYHGRLETLKDLYAPFDPDSDTRLLSQPGPDERAAVLDALFKNFTELMDRANFHRLDRDEILRSTQGESGAFGINMDVDMDVFERIEVFCRGDTVLRRPIRRWWRLWRRQELVTPAYQRLVMIFRLRKHKRLDGDIDTDDVFLKIFKDIPKMDLDMLLPGAQVRLTRLDRSLIVYPLAFGAGLVLWNIVQDFGWNLWEAMFSAGAAAAVVAGVTAKVASWTVAAAFGGYGYKSYYSFQVKKQTYSLRLTRSLYYQSLDNNTGVLVRMLDETEEQECREVYLAYFFLWQSADGCSADELDRRVERELERRANVKVDFEVADALAKLERLGIVARAGDRYRAVPMERALEKLDCAWDNYFQYSGTSK